MKFLILLIITSFNIYATESVVVPAQNLYTPQGFDTNDETQVVVSGYLPSYCYKEASHQTTIDKQKKEINIQINAKYEDDELCPQSTKNFLKTINLGSLEPGEYRIRTRGREDYDITDKLHIKRDNLGRIDEFKYPFINSVKYLRDKNKLYIKGYKPSNCYKLAGTEFYSDRKNVIIAQPILKKVREFCPRKMISIDYEVTPPQLVKSLVTLIHVRSQGQESVNVEVIF